MDGQNDGQRNKYTCCAWAGGTFFPVVPLCHFFVVVAGNSFRCYLPTIPVVPLWLVAQVSFLVVAGNSSQNENTFLQKNLIGLLYYNSLANVCIS